MDLGKKEWTKRGWKNWAKKLETKGLREMAKTAMVQTGDEDNW